MEIMMMLRKGDDDLSSCERVARLEEATAFDNLGTYLSYTPRCKRGSALSYEIERQRRYLVSERAYDVRRLWPCTAHNGNAADMDIQ